MDKKTNLRIKHSIEKENLIIKKEIHHKNKDVTLRYGKGEIVKKEQAPAWFTNWSTNFEKKNDERWEKQETFNKNQMAFNKNQEAFNKNQETFNKNQMAFNEQVIDELHEIKNRLNKVESLPTIQKELQAK